MHAHRVEVLDRADDDAVPARVRHHLELELLPALERLLDQHLPHGARLEPARDERLELRRRARDAAAAPAERERRAYDRRDRSECLTPGRDDLGPGHFEAGRDDRVSEGEPVLGAADRVDRRAEQLDAVLREDAGLVQLD